MEGKEYEENQSSFSFNKKGNPHSECKFETIILKPSCTSHIYQWW